MQVIVKSNVMNKLELYPKLVTGEIGGLMNVKEQKNKLIIEDIIILKQKVGGAHFRLDEDALFEFLKTNKRRAHRFKGWWHSHANFEAFWSGVDDATFDMMAGMSKFALGVVTNKRKNQVWKIVSNDGTIEVPEVIIEKSSFFKKLLMWNKMKKEVQEKVSEDDITITEEGDVEVVEFDSKEFESEEEGEDDWRNNVYETD